MKMRKFPFRLNFDFTTLLKQDTNSNKNFEEATKKLNQMLLGTKEIEDHSKITSIFHDLKDIKLQSKSYAISKKK